MAPKTYHVTSLADSGSGSLRSGILFANKNRCDTTIITFGVSGIIILSSALPALTSHVAIDGGSSVRVEIDFNSYAGLAFAPGSEGSILQGLSLTNSNGNGVTISSDRVELYNNYIGVSKDGTAKGNRGHGILVVGKKVKIGSNPTATSGLPSNIISANQGDGIHLKGATGAIIVSNFIGTNVDGTSAYPNEGSGIFIEGGSNNIIGGTVYTNSAGLTNNPTGSKGTVPIVSIFPPLGNLISGNLTHGVYLTQTSNNTLYGNFIGTDVSGNNPLGNTEDGVKFYKANTNSMIGCTFVQNPFVYYNVCSGNLGNGITVQDSNDVTIQGNFAGIGANNATLVSNGGNGLSVVGTSKGITVGGVIPLGNVMAGNTGHGIGVYDEVSNFITFNTFGGLYAFGAAAPNGGCGFYISSIGGNNVARTNVFSGNATNGIMIENATGVIIEECIVGLNTIGNAPLPNGQNGLVIAGDAHANFIGRNVPSVIPRNTFSGNVENGVVLTDTAHNNLISFSFVGLDVTGRYDMGNGGDGIRVESSAHDNFIGTNLIPPAIYTNYSSYNGGYGVNLVDACTANIIANNHLDLTILEGSAPNVLGPIGDTSSGTNILINNL